MQISIRDQDEIRYQLEYLSRRGVTVRDCGNRMAAIEKEQNVIAYLHQDPRSPMLSIYCTWRGVEVVTRA